MDMADYWARARSVLVFTGAGISTGSGIPDFRGPQGIWKKRQPVYLQDFLQAEEKRIEYWDYKLEGYQGFRDARPNAAHLALAELEKLGALDTLVTQNIDGLQSDQHRSQRRGGLNYLPASQTPAADLCPIPTVCPQIGWVATIS